MAPAYGCNMRPMTAVAPSKPAGAQLKAARQSVGLSRQRLATMANCSTAWIQQLEAGVQPADSPTLERLWAILGSMRPPGSGGT